MTISNDPITHSPSNLISPDGLAALANAGRSAGEYLGAIGQTDVAKLSREEWQRFIATIALGYEDFRRAEAQGLA